MKNYKQFRRGAIANLPIAPSVIAYGSVFGVLASQKGISWIELLVMNFSIFAGSSLFVMVEMWETKIYIIEILLAVFIINLRYLLICASLNPLFINATIWQKITMIHFVADENWAVTISENRSGFADIWFLLGGGIFIMLVWCFGTLLGHQLGTVIEDPKKYALDFAFLAVFTAFTVNLWRGKEDTLPWIGAAVIAILIEKFFPGKWYIFFGGIGGALLTFFQNHNTK
jgi:4-azaleucine resistance transporter AzlC